MTAATFFQEFQKLIYSHPKRPGNILYSENCEYGNYVYHSKNLYQCFDCVSCVSSTYLFDSQTSVNSADCDFSADSELCYESVTAIKCFNSNYVSNCQNTIDSWYSYDCINCHDVFGSVRLRNKSFCLFNRQLNEADYEEQVAYYRTLPAARILAYVNQLYAQQPWTQTNELNNENCSYGNYFYNNKNSYMCFDASRNEFSGYLYDAYDNKYAYDIVQSSHIELSYEVLDSTKVFNSDHIIFVDHCMDSSYIIDCSNIKNSMGCIMANNKQYCFLNRQLSKEDYERITIPLLVELRSKDYGFGNILY